MKIIQIISSLLFITGFSYSNTPRINYIDDSNGLSNNDVTTFYQDKRGLMWIGTYDGLNRYDGYNFITYRKNLSNSNSLINNRISCITQDHQNDIWIGTLHGISRLDYTNHKFYSISFKEAVSKRIKQIQGAINIIKEDAFHNIFIASEKEGVLVYNFKSDIAEQIPLYTSAHKISFNYVASSLSFDKQGILWIMVRNVGLCRYNVEKKMLEVYSNIIKEAIYILAGPSGNIWMGTDNGLYEYSISKKKILRSLLSGKKINHLSFDHQDILWITSDGNGIFTITPSDSSIKQYLLGGASDSINNMVIYSVYEDRENRKWIGAIRSGIIVIDPNKMLFRTFSHKLNNESNPNVDFILTFCEDVQHNLWVGTDGGGIKRWNADRSKFATIKNVPGDKKSLSGNFVTNIIKDRLNRLWISTWGDGLNLYNYKTGKFKRYKLNNPQTKIEDRFTWRLYEDHAGVIWVSTYKGGLYRYNTKKDVFDFFANITNVLSLLEDKMGNFWAGDFTSLIRIDRNSRKAYYINIGYPVRAIYEDKMLSFWVGTEGGGLLQFDRAKERFHRFTEEKGLPSNSLLNILEDAQHNLWLSTYNGISCFNNTRTRFRNYSQSNGLQTNQFNYNAALTLSNGDFLFGGIKGFNIFNPLQTGKPLPKVNKLWSLVFIDDIKINNSDINSYKHYIPKIGEGNIAELTIPYYTSTLTFTFLVPEFSAPDKIQYAYRLKGKDQQWNYSGNVRTVNYTGLPAGPYILEAKATDRNGNWNEGAELIKIIVLPPWYQKWWAYMIYFSIITGALTIFYKYKKGKQEADYKIKLATIEKEKEKEISEKRLSFFTSISHEFRTPLTLILNPLKELIKLENKPAIISELDVAYRNAKRLLSLVDQLLLIRKAESEFDELKLSKVNLRDFCHEIYSYFLQQAKNKRIDYLFICNESELELDIDREKTEIALFNILANAIKFTPEGGNILTEIKTSGKMLDIKISDSGIGIDEGVGEKLFENFYQAKLGQEKKNIGFGIGLYLARKFIVQQGGSISYTSKLGTGTKFNIKLPIKTGLIDTVEKSSHIPNSPLLSEIVDGYEQVITKEIEPTNIIITEKKSLLIIDDNADIRNYIQEIFNKKVVVYEAVDGVSGLAMVEDLAPDLIISDLYMPGLTGIELCRKVKGNLAISHIPIILLTGSNTDETKLEGIESGAVDYITKPFDKALLVAKVESLLENKSRLQHYFLEIITLQRSTSKVPLTYKTFLEKCITVVEDNIDDDNFNVQQLAKEMGISYSSLYNKVKAVSGLSVNGFIRSIRLRKAAVLMLKNDTNVNQASFEVGIADLKYFRKHFFNLFGLMPSEYIRKYRNNFNRDHTISK